MVAPDNNPPLVEITGLCKWYGEFSALFNINLNIFAGEKVVVCGPSGSGKSTMVRCINQLEVHQAGSIKVEGREVTPIMKNIENVLRDVGMVFQNFNLFPHMTIVDNLTLGPMRNRGISKSDATEIAMHYLQRVQISEQAEKYPSQLSGGQQQRAAIARSLCMKPKIILFDEPTSALDPEMIAGVLDVMVELAEEGMTMMCITHEMGFARKVADQIVFMDEGEIIEIADPDTFFNNPQSERAKLFLNQIIRH